MRWTLSLCTLAVSLFAATDESTATPARIELSGTLHRQRDRVTLRSSNADYELDFVDSALQGFALALDNERVVVRGDLAMRRARGTLVPTIQPDYIARAGANQAVSVRTPQPAIEPPVDESLSTSFALPPENRVERRRDQVRSYDYDDARDPAPAYYNRVQRRRLHVRDRRANDRNPLQHGTYMTPGGTVIINNP